MAVEPMPAEPGHGMAPLSYGQMRAAHADRERAIDVLKAAFAEGRLDKDEYDGRVGQVYASRTYAELATLTADLPAGPLGTLDPQPAPALPEPLPPQRRAVSRRRRASPVMIVLPLIFLLLVSRGELYASKAGILLAIGIVLFMFRRFR